MTNYEIGVIRLQIKAEKPENEQKPKASRNEMNSTHHSSGRVGSDGELVVALVILVEKIYQTIKRKICNQHHFADLGYMNPNTP